MADTAVTPLDLVASVASAANPANTTVNATDTAVVTASRTGRLIYRLAGPAGGATVTFKAGVTGQTPANLAVKGDLVVTLGANEIKYVVLEAGRFVTAVGTVRADVATGNVGFLVVRSDRSA